jgi:arylsulfatase A-like enzyme
MRFPLLAAALLTAAAAAAPAAEPSAGPPNILMILVDDLGSGDLSASGAKDVRTPHLDALFAAGMRFDRFYSNSPVCSPTRAGLLTGRHPDLVGVPGVIRTNPADSWGRLAREAVLLPSILKPAGYQTAIVGKWHLGLDSPDTPLERGFDRFRGFLGDMMDDYVTHRRNGKNFMRRDAEEIDPEGHATDLFTQWAVEHLKERAAAKAPFFLYLAYNAPHTPLQPPAAWLEKVRAREPGIAEKRAKLVALIEHLDDGIGKVLASLLETGLAERTLVVFASDNGGDAGAAGTNGALRGAKGGMYEGGIRVPMAAAWPGRIRPGSRSDRVGLTMDLFPTFCEAAGIATPAGIDGRSLLPELLGKPMPEETRTLFWVRREGGPFKGGVFHAARRGDLKLLQAGPDKPFEMFDLAADPAERSPLPENHPGRRPLEEALRAHVARAAAVPWK